ncbi:MAG: hypothetical protein WCX74_01945 [Candidatus Paceibacterota bacterium]
MVEKERIGGLSGPVRYVFAHGRFDCKHEFAIVPSPFEDYGGQCRVCSECGRVETWPEPKESYEFHGMTGIYVLNEDGTPGQQVSSGI